MANGTSGQGFEYEALDEEDQALFVMDSILAEGHPHHVALVAAIERYPGHASLLAEYVLAAPSRHATDAVQTDDATENLVNERALILATRMAANRQAETELHGILSRISERHLNASDICRKLRIGNSVLVKLDRRLIDFASVPQRFLMQLSREILTTADSLASYLESAPRMSPAADFKSIRKPKVSRTEPFALSIKAAVESGEIEETDAAYWQNNGESLL